MEQLGELLIWFFTGIPGIEDAMAAILALILIGVAVAIIVRHSRKHHRPLLKAIKERVPHQHLWHRLAVEV